MYFGKFCNSSRKHKYRGSIRLQKIWKNLDKILLKGLRNESLKSCEITNLKFQQNLFLLIQFPMLAFTSSRINDVIDTLKRYGNSKKLHTGECILGKS